MAGSRVAMRSLLRSKGHIGKEAVKFQFDITIDALHGLPTGPHSIKWTRGGRVAYTKPFQIERKSMQKLEVGQKLSLLCTLYRPKVGPKNDAYDAKDSKLSLVSYKNGKKNETTIGKIHFNISEYAGVPSAEASVRFKLNSKTQVEVTITCTFVQVANGTSSAGSGVSALSDSSAELEGNDDFADEDSEEDLGIDSGELAGKASEDPCSPVTPEPNRGPFEAARSIFESNEDVPDRQVGTKHTTGRVKPSAAKFAGNGYEDDTAKEAQTELTQKDKMQDKKMHRVPLTVAKTLGKGAAPEPSTENIQNDIIVLQKELQRVKELHRVSEEVILELRHAMSKKELEMKSVHNKQSNTLRKKITEMNKELEDVESRAKQAADNYEERLGSMQLQVESLSRAKQRTEEELNNVKLELDVLGSGSHADTSQLSRRNTEQRLDEVRREHDSAQTQLSAEVAKRRGLEAKCRDLTNEISRLNSKLVAHEEHAVTIKKTYEDLSEMYKELREQHLLVQQELKAYREGPSSSFQKSDSRTENDRSRLRGKRNKIDRRENGLATKEDLQEITNLRTSLNDANRRLVEMETEKAESEHQRNSLSADVEKMKEELESNRAEVWEKSQACDQMTAKYLKACEELEESGRKTSLLQRRLTRMESSSEEAGTALPIECQIPNTVLSTEEASEVRRKIANLFACVIQAKKTIQKMRQELQGASDREDAYIVEISRLKDTIDALTPRIKRIIEHEKAKRKEAELAVEAMRSRACNAEGSLKELIEKEIHYREDIRRLKEAVVGLEEKSGAVQQANSSALSASRSELRLKEEEIQRHAKRNESLERELAAKKEASETLSCRVRELELECQIIKKQARYEVDLAKEAARQDGASRRNQEAQAIQCKEEISNLQVVAESLRKELLDSRQQTETEAQNVSAGYRENEKLRRETSLARKEFIAELKAQQGIIDALQEKLQEAAEKNRKVSADAAKEAEKLIALVQEKQQAEEDLITESSVREELQSTVAQLSQIVEDKNDKIQESAKKTERSMERAAKKLDEKEQQLLEAAEREAELREQLDGQEQRFAEMRREIDSTLKQSLELASQNEHLSGLSGNVKADLIERESELSLAQKSLHETQNERDTLKCRVSELRGEVAELQSSVASLRGQLSESQSSQAALLAAATEDSSRTAAELEEAKNREETYQRDVAKKSELIEELTSKLTDAVGKSAADSARASAELSEALIREATLKEELEKLRNECQDLEDELAKLESRTAMASAGLQAELSEATSREETYRDEANALKEAMEEVEAKLEQTQKEVKERELKRMGENSSTERRANKAVAEVLGIGQGSLSSSNIRQLDMFEQITDARLLEMLVDTKMQLAVAEEEKLQLEHLMQRIREGDKHVEEKLAEEAASMEMGPTKAYSEAASIQDASMKRKSTRGGRGSDADRVRREKSMAKGGQLQFFRRFSKKKSKADDRNGWNGGTSRRYEAPQDEWDIGDDSHDGDNPGSDDTSCSTESSE